MCRHPRLDSLAAARGRRQGAKLVETAKDILEELRWPGRAMAAPAGASPGDDPMLVALSFDRSRSMPWSPPRVRPRQN